MSASHTIVQSNFQSIPKQQKRLAERHVTPSLHAQPLGVDIVVDQGVYQTSTDTELMIQSVKINLSDTFLEVGCGSGAVSIAIAKRSGQGIGVDINQLAVANSVRNAQLQNCTNVQFLVSNVFENVTGQYDVIICNPPYTNHEVNDAIDRMFWDPNDEMKIAFFQSVGQYLKPDGHIYFGWANFGDIDVDLPFKLADQYGFQCVNSYRQVHNPDVTFYVLEFVRKAS